MGLGPRPSVRAAGRSRGPATRSAEERAFRHEWAVELARKRRVAQLDREIAAGEAELRAKEKKYGVRLVHEPSARDRRRRRGGDEQRERDELAARIRAARRTAMWLPAGRGTSTERPTLSAPEMKTFEKLVGTLGKDELGDVQVIGLQHMKRQSGALARAFAALGVKPWNIHLIGKTYSQNEEVMADLRKDGFSTHVSSFEGRLDVKFSPFGASEGSLANRPREIMNEIDKVVRRDPHGKSKIVVVDDGGDLIATLHHAYPELHDRIVAVEQTRKGLRRIEGLPLKFPVIDVAQSWGKLTWESPMIGRSLAQSTRNKLRSLKVRGVDPGKKILVIGYGAVGRAAARSLHAAGYAVEVYDQSADATAEARRDPSIAGVHTDLHTGLASCKVVLSLTGTSTLDAKTLEHAQQGTVLLNGASGAAEFLPEVDQLTRYDRWPRVQMQARKKGVRMVASTTFGGKPFVVGRSRMGEPFAGEDWVLRLPSGKELILGNSGHVLNFGKGVDAVPPRYIQLTTGLLLMGVVQARKSAVPGIHALAEEPQRRYVKDLQSELAATGESLDHPKF